MTAGGEILRAENSLLNVFAKKIFVWIRGHGPIGCQMATFRAQHDFFARKPFRGKLLERGADAALAALKAVVDGAVDDVDAVFHGGNDSGGVSRISFLVGLSKIGSD